jgi:hypothetical protein
LLVYYAKRTSRAAASGAPRRICSAALGSSPGSAGRGDVVMLTFDAKQKTRFVYYPTLDGDVYITSVLGEAIVPAADLMQFCAHVAGVPEIGSEEETEAIMGMLDGAGVFDRSKSREEIRESLRSRLRGEYAAT